MNLLKLLKAAISPRLEPGLLVKFHEMILIVDPHTLATINPPMGSQLIVTGYAGILWITVEGSQDDYKIRNGESAKIPGGGKVVIQPLTAHVPCRLHVVYEPPPRITH